MVNEALSPRSRTSQLDPTLDIVDRSAGTVDEALELDRELAWLRVALNKLPPPSQRQALLEAPAQMPATAEAKPDQVLRSAHATHSLRSRARKSLRRAYLQVVLEEGAPPSCHDAIAQLPAQVGDSPDLTPEAPQHLHSCERCKRRWAVFAGLAGSLGIAGVAVVQAEQPEVSPFLSEDQPVAAASLSTGRRLPARTMILAGSAIATVGVTLVTLALFGPQLGIGSTQTASASGLPFGTVLRVPLQSESPVGPEPVVASMHYSATGVSGANTGPLRGDAADLAPGLVAVRLDFEVSAESWRTQSVDWNLPGTLSIASAPNGWQCNGNTCTTDATGAFGGTFVLRGAAASSEDRIEVRWIAGSAGRLVSARASSNIPAAGETFVTSATDTSSE